MFGDNILAGSQEITIDERHRMFLPAKSGREYKEVVFLVYDKDISRYAVYSEKIFEERSNKLEELVLNAKTDKERIKRKLLLYDFYGSVLKLCSVDKQGRIILSEEFVPGETLTTVGAKDHLILVRQKDSKSKK